MNIFLFLFSFCNVFLYHFVCSQNALVNIDRKNVENFISDKFISFIIDPQILLQKNGLDQRSECFCMANSLSPAYIQIGGPAIKAISLDESNHELKTTQDRDEVDSNILWNSQSLSFEMWTNFVNWTKNTNIIPIVKLDFSERFHNGNWNPSSTIKIFSIADKFKLGECVWQLDYDCSDQTLDTYIDDLKTLKIIMDAFTSAKNGNWKIVSGEVTKCLNQDDSNALTSFIYKSSYVVDSLIFDSVADELFSNLSSNLKAEIQSDLIKKNTQLWKTSNIYGNTPQEKALYWLQELGNAAKHGYSVTFKDLNEEDLDNPTLSYYVSLIHKKFVGPEVLKLDVKLDDSDDLSVYGHCAILPNGRIQNGITLFAVNMGDSDANVTFEFSIKENGGEIMQFVLQSEEGKILVNGDEMLHDGDLQPVMSEVTPFKAMRVFLPSKSIGFWIITNTNIEACSSKNEMIKKPMYRNLKHKQLQPEDMAEVLENLLLQNFNKNQARNTRSVDADLEEYEKKMIEHSRLAAGDQNLSEESFKLVKEKAKSMGPYANFGELFSILGQLSKMVELEKEFFDIGQAMLKSNETSLNDTSDFIINDDNKMENSTLKPLVRIIRDTDNMDSFTEIVSESSEQNLNQDIQIDEFDATENQGNEPKLGELKLPKLPVNVLNNTKELDDLIKRARKLLKHLNNTINDNTSVENLDSLNENSPLVSLPGLKDPETFLKGELFKSKIKLRELQRKIKARIAEIDIKTKVKSAFPHGILKRSAEYKASNKVAVDGVLKKNKALPKQFRKNKMNKYQMKKLNQRVKRFLMQTKLYDEIQNEIDHSVSGKEVEDDYKTKTEIVNLNNSNQSIEMNDTNSEEDRVKNMIPKTPFVSTCLTSADNLDEIRDEKLTWSDLTEKFGGLEETEDTLTKILNNISGFFDSMKNKVKETWNKVVNNN